VLTADVNSAGQIHRLRAITNPIKLAAVSPLAGNQCLDSGALV
jgi:hypothetical protein